MCVHFPLLLYAGEAKHAEGAPFDCSVVRKMCGTPGDDEMADEDGQQQAGDGQSDESARSYEVSIVNPNPNNLKAEAELKGNGNKRSMQAEKKKKKKIDPLLLCTGCRAAPRAIVRRQDVKQNALCLFCFDCRKPAYDDDPLHHTPYCSMTIGSLRHATQHMFVAQCVR